MQAQVAAAAGPSPNAVDDAELEDITMAEVERGWLVGPIEPDDLTRDLGCWLPSRRFGIRQGKKLRAVDDYSASLVNCALAAQETIDPADVDHIAANVRAHMDALSAPSVLRPSQSPFHGMVRHPEVEGDSLVGRLWDLKQASWQLARAPGHASLTVIAVWSARHGRMQYFKQLALPFGASASVLGFNWTATALSTALCGHLRVGSTNFYDDFCVLERVELAASAAEATEGALRYLGVGPEGAPRFLGAAGTPRRGV